MTVTGHVYPADHGVFWRGQGDTTTDETFRARNSRLVAALRSGTFQQVKGYLELNPTSDEGTKKGNCCLGVACIVAGTFHEDDDTLTVYRRQQVGSAVVGFGVNGNLHSFEQGTPPGIVRDWYGWRDVDPELFDPDGFAMPATTRNDSREESFDIIADAFERTYVTYTYEGQPESTEDSPAESTEDTLTDRA